jgi:Sulfotransferase family
VSADVIPPTSLDPEVILAAAGADPSMAVTDWAQALARVTESARDEGGLSAAGAEAFSAKLVQLAGERLQAQALLEQNPEVAARPLAVRFAVAGMGRSGTTLLQRLLGCDPDVCFLPTWQAMRPVPPVRNGVIQPDEDRRRDGVVEQIAAIARAHPESMRIHPLDADAPEEEVFLLQHSFASMLFALNCPLPTYNAWLSGTDHDEAYRFAFDLLRLNEWAADAPAGQPRVMKSPQFLLDLRVVTRLTGDAVIAQTHRDPVDLVGSYCSTYANSRRRSMASLDPVAIGKERLEFLGLMADRAVAVRDDTESTPPQRFVDVHYATLVSDPFEVIEQLYAAARVDLTGQARQRMQDWLDDHPQHQAGKHSYSLDDYGLDRTTVETRFASYLERFQVVRDDDAG